MTNKLSLYNGALRILKHRKIALTDNVEARHLLDDEYDKVIAWCLEQGLWNFALRATALEADVEIEPEFGHSYAFEQPLDYVRLNAISSNGHFNPTLEHYVDEGGYWLASTNPIYVSYVSNGNDFGGDLSRWTATFVLAVEYELAYRIAPHLTSMGEDAARELERRRDKSMRDARSKDALNQPAQRPPPGRLVQSRIGSGSASGRPWWR